ncbi:MAG: zinc-ribbon domain-containing protein [Methanomassiliicoccales archaeon]
MQLDLTLKIIFLVALIGGLGLVLYIELRYMRKKRNPRIEAKLRKDEAYNAIVTTRAVSRVLRERGNDVSEAERVIEQARMAYDARDYSRTIELAEEAKEVLQSSEVKKEEEADLSAFDQVISPGKEEETHKLFEEKKKMPDNYLESKFMIGNTQHAIDEAEGSGKEVGEASELLESARKSFDGGDYGEAFTLACKAKRSLIGASDEFIEESVVSMEEKADSPEVESGARVEPPEEGMESENICRECGAPLEEGDLFCGQCGSRTRRECPSCGSELREGDRFCRRCGEPVE